MAYRYWRRRSPQRKAKIKERVRGLRRLASPSGDLPRGSPTLRIPMRLVRAVRFTPSGVDLLPVALAPVSGRGVVAAPAVRAKTLVHPLVSRKGREGQPLTTGSAALMGSPRDHRFRFPIVFFSRERFSRGMLARGLWSALSRNRFLVQAHRFGTG